MSIRVYLFQCPTSDLYALTREESGANLPSDQCAAAWRPVKAVDFAATMSSWAVDIAWQERDAAALAGLQENGFFLAEAHSLPEAFKQSPS